MRCKRFASKIGKFPIRSCSSGKEGKHYFIAYTSGYMQGQGWQVGRQAGRAAGSRQKLEVRREVLEPLTIYTQEGKRRRKERKKYSRRGMLFTSPPSPLTPNFRGVWHLSSTQSFAAQPAKSLRRRRTLLAPPSGQPRRASRLIATRQSYVLVSFPIGPRVKKKLLQLLLAIACLPAPGKVPVYFFRGIRKKKSVALGFALSINLASEGKAKSFPHSQMGREIKIWQRLDGVVVVYYYSSIMAEKRAHLFLQLPPSPLS